MTQQYETVQEMPWGGPIRYIVTRRIRKIFQGYLIKKIEDGTVIDHIYPPGIALNVLGAVGYITTDENGLHLKPGVRLVTDIFSEILGRKDLVMLDQEYLTKEQKARIALVSITATVNTIKNGHVESKETEELPQELRNMVIDLNEKCISMDLNEHVDTLFEFVNGSKPRYRCHYCGTIIEEPFTRFIRTPEGIMKEKKLYAEREAERIRIAKEKEEMSKLLQPKI